jgi:mRNA interferase RelE/StbE
VTYRLTLSAAARRALTEVLPEGVAAACWEFINGALLENPHQVGKQLREELDDIWSARRGSYRVLYRINEDMIVVEVVKISHRRDVYH